MFINDFVGISLRQQRAQTLFQYHRRFSTRPPARQLEDVARAPANDEYVPFDVEGAKPSVDDVQSAKSQRKQEPEKQRRDDTTADKEWHAGIETIAPSSAGEVDTAANALLDASALGQSDKSVDNVAFGGLHPPQKRGATDVEPAVLLQEPAAPPQKSRAESRMERKERRMQTGTYRASAESRRRDEAADSQVRTVLNKINELDGPRQARVKALEKFKKHEAGKGDIKREVKPKMDKAASIRASNPLPKPKKEDWQTQKKALELKFGEVGWQPRKRLSPDTLEGIRALHASDPAAYSTETLSEHFKVAPEAIRRILKSKWRPDDEETEDRRIRWERRGVKKWQDMAEQGVRPPAKWRAMGVSSEGGPNEDKVPKRRTKRSDDKHLSWDDVVGGNRHEEELPHENLLAGRIL